MTHDSWSEYKRRLEVSRRHLVETAPVGSRWRRVWGTRVHIYVVVSHQVNVGNPGVMCERPDLPPLPHGGERRPIRRSAAWLRDKCELVGYETPKGGE